jgi:hypothetical protein
VIGPSVAAQLDRMAAPVIGAIDFSQEGHQPLTAKSEFPRKAVCLHSVCKRIAAPFPAAWARTQRALQGRIRARSGTGGADMECRHKPDSPFMTLGRPLMSLKFARCYVMSPADRCQRTGGFGRARYSVTTNRLEQIRRSNVDSRLPGGSRPSEENLPPGWRLRRSPIALGPFLLAPPPRWLVRKEHRRGLRDLVASPRK